jgi:serine protease Do
LIAGLGPDKKAKMVVVRDGKQKNFTVVLGERKEEAVVASIPPQPESLYGLTIEDLTSELAERYKLKENTGAVITRVKPGTIAESKGLKEGDLIREVNRKEVNNTKEFKDAVADVKEGDSVLFRVVRENRALYILLKPESE